MLHFGHFPGVFCTTSGWCTHVYCAADSDVLSAFLHPVMENAPVATLTATSSVTIKRFSFIVPLVYFDSRGHLALREQRWPHGRNATPRLIGKLIAQRRLLRAFNIDVIAL